jgi:hypothetical protein
LVEIEEQLQEGGIERAAKPLETVKKVSETLENVLDRVREVAETAVGKLTTLVSRPEEVGIEFGIKLGAEGGIVIASGSVEANFKVSLKWKGSKDDGR